MFCKRVALEYEKPPSLRTFSLQLTGSATIARTVSKLKASTTRIIIPLTRKKKSLFASIFSQLEKQMSQNNNQLSKTQKLCHSQLIV